MVNLVYLILLTLPTYLVRYKIFGIPTTLLELEIYILAIIFFIDSTSNKYLMESVKRFINNPFIIPLALFFIAGVMSIFIAPDKIVSLGIFKAYFFDAILFFFLFVSIVRKEKEIRGSIISVTIGAVVSSLIGLIQYFCFPYFLQEGRIVSLFSSPNYLSLFITPVIFLAFYLFKYKVNSRVMITKINFFQYLALLILVITLVFTYSRGAWLAFLISLLFYIGLIIAKRIKQGRTIVAAGFIIGLLLVFLFITKGSYFLNIVPNDRIIKSDDVRIEIWKTSLEIGRNNWILGIGLGNFQDYFGEYTSDRINYSEYITPHALTPHNMFLNIWLQVGLLGLLGILGLLGAFFLCGWRMLRANFLLSIVLLTSMVAIITQGLVDSSIWKNDLMIYFWFLIGLMSVIKNKKSKNA